MVPLAIGSDGGGSVRVPAALAASTASSLVGPRSRLSGLPRRALSGISSWESLEHIGPITRTVADAALALSVLVGPTPRDRASLPAEVADWMVRPATRCAARASPTAPTRPRAVDPELRAAPRRRRRASPMRSARSWCKRTRASATSVQHSRRSSRSTPTARACGAWRASRASRSKAGSAAWSSAPGPPTSSPPRRWSASASSTAPGASWKTTTSCSRRRPRAAFPIASKGRRDRRPDGRGRPGSRSRRWQPHRPARRFGPDRPHTRRPADRPADHGPPPRRSRRARARRGGRVAYPQPAWPGPRPP